jgi:hypothetical protein
MSEGGRGFYDGFNVQTVEHWTAGGLMNEKLERLWKEAVACPRTCLQGVTKATKNLSRDCRWLDRDSNRALPRYRSRVLLPDQPVLHKVNQNNI